MGCCLGPQLPNPGSDEGTDGGIRAADSGSEVLLGDATPAILIGEPSNIQDTCVCWAKFILSQAYLWRSLTSKLLQFKTVVLNLWVVT